jgi:cytochrome d ubiquinol oxidase subunit II
MTLELIAGALALLAVILYAVLAGADFGGGVWDLFSNGSRAVEQREAIGEAMGPVWETNHVWLIFLIVLLFTCFPPVFAVLGEKLFAPLTGALFGIVLRGAAFAFRGPATRDLLPHKIWGVVFGVASLATPFLFGASAAGIAKGDFDWKSALGAAVGIFAVALCAQLAAVYLVADTVGPLRRDFKIRAYWATLAVAVTGIVPLAVAHASEPTLVERIAKPLPLAIIGCAMVLGVLVVTLVRLDLAGWARIAVAAEVTAVLCGWYSAQAPYALAQLGVAQPAAPDSTLGVFLWSCAAGAVVLIPSLALLFAIFKRTPVHAAKQKE